MKKLLILTLATLPMLFACNKGSKVPETMDKPTYAEQSAKVEIDNPIPVKTKDGRDVYLKEVNFMRSGRYVAEAIISRVKSEDEITILSGTYTFTSGNYVTSGDLTVTMNVKEETITIGNAISSGTVTHTDIPEGSLMDQLARTWKLDHYILNFKALGGSARYENIGELVTDMLAHKINISSETAARIREHEVKEITVDAGIITVSFTQAEAFKGQFMLDNSGIFSFKFEGQGMDSDIFEAEASGKVTVTGDKVVIKMEVKSNLEDLGNGSAEIHLVATK